MGYGDMTDDFTNQKREVYRCYLALRTKTQGKDRVKTSECLFNTLRRSANNTKIAINIT